MDIKYLLNDALNKALVGKNRIKGVADSNKIGKFVNKYIEAEQLNIGVVFNEDDEAKAQQEENIVTIMQADENDGIYQSEVDLSRDCPICVKEMTSQLVRHHHCKKCKEHYTTT